MEVVKMAYPVLTGAVLIEANGAALNNAGLAEDVRTEQTIVVKSVRVGRLHFPYVSGQAWRRWWREVLYADFGWKPSPMFVSKKPQQAFTKGDPITYEEDDLFGYMAARKRADKRSRKSEEEEIAEAAKGTNRRISPLKNSLLISVLPNVIVRDFAHLSRHQQDAQIRLLPDSPSQDPLLWGSEHYTTYLQGVFTISLSDVGRFVVGERLTFQKKSLESTEMNSNRTQAMGVSIGFPNPNASGELKMSSLLLLVCEVAPILPATFQMLLQSWFSLASLMAATLHSSEFLNPTITMSVSF
jgi:CRISPR-associated protein Cst2